MRFKRLDWGEERFRIAILDSGGREALLRVEALFPRADQGNGAISLGNLAMGIPLLAAINRDK